MTTTDGVPKRSAELVAEGFYFPEGPRWHDGRLYFSDFYDHRVVALAPDGSETTICEVPGQPSGLGFGADGELMVVSMKDRRLLRLVGGELQVVAELAEWVGGDCNDMLVDDRGRAWVGNFGFETVPDKPVRPTVLLRVDPDGAVTEVADELVFPNGIVITSENELLISETFAYRISAFDVAADGSLSNRRAWASFGEPPARDLPEILSRPELAPDGICLDAEGALWVGNATGHGAHRVAPGGEILESVELGELTAFAAALGGEDGRTLYLCAGPPLGAIDPASTRAGSIWSTRVEHPGAAWA